MANRMDSPENFPQDLAEHFASHVAHDFNNLLTGILGNLELLQLRTTRNGIGGLEAYLEGANSAGTRAVAFAARLMLYSGRGTSPPALVRPDAVLEKFTTQTTQMACSLQAGAATVLCDPGQLELAVAELTTNAAAAGGTIFISTALTASQVVITVRDTGHGMSPKILARAHEPFFTTATSGTGRGLGLPIVARVMRTMGGRMDIQTAEGAGCTVTLHLPRR